MPSALRRICGAAIVLGALCAGARAATILPVGFAETILDQTLKKATAMALLPDGRILVAEQEGLLRVVKNDVLLPTAALSLTVSFSGERGLLGVTPDPNFAGNGFIYVYYTVPTPAHNRVSRFTMTGDTAASELILLELDNLSTATNHNGGALHFGNDGKLYIAVGENANGANAQSLANLLGKILRINSDGSIPADNPFFTTPVGARKEIWAYGLRNPYTFDFRSDGRMFINDVGQSTYEEIDDGIAGSNYGWPTAEGPNPPGNPNFRYPLYTYQHSSGTPTGCAITGGVFYDPAAPSFSTFYTGKYFFADFCGNFIWLFDPATSTAASFASGLPSPVDLQVDAQGRLLYLGHGSSTNSVLARISALPALRLFTLTPCRVLDTRSADAPALAAGATRTFPVALRCGVPASAKAVSVNLTVVTPTQPGSALAFPGNFAAPPNANGVSFRAGQTRANNLALALATNGDGSVKIQNTSTAPLEVLLDVNGYFE
jgi:glucose/arabinose dehydrogenase